MAQGIGAGLAGPNTQPNLFSQLQLKERIQEHHITDIRDLQELRKSLIAANLMLCYI